MDFVALILAVAFGAGIYFLVIKDDGKPRGSGSAGNSDGDSQSK